MPRATHQICKNKADPSERRSSCDFPDPRSSASVSPSPEQFGDIGRAARAEATSDLEDRRRRDANRGSSRQGSHPPVESLAAAGRCCPFVARRPVYRPPSEIILKAVSEGLELAESRTPRSGSAEPWSSRLERLLHPVEPFFVDETPPTSARRPRRRLSDIWNWIRRGRQRRRGAKARRRSLDIHRRYRADRPQAAAARRGRRGHESSCCLNRRRSPGAPEARRPSRQPSFRAVSDIAYVLQGKGRLRQSPRPVAAQHHRLRRGRTSRLTEVVRTSFDQGAARRRLDRSRDLDPRRQSGRALTSRLPAGPPPPIPLTVATSRCPMRPESQTRSSPESSCTPPRPPRA